MVMPYLRCMIDRFELPCSLRLPSSMVSSIVLLEGELIDPDRVAQLWDDAAGIPSPDVSDVGEPEDAVVSKPEINTALADKEPFSAVAMVAPAADGVSVREVAEEASSALAKLDVLIEAATECGQPRILALAKRARLQTHKEVAGSAKDDPLVVSSIVAAEESYERNRLAKRAAPRT